MPDYAWVCHSCKASNSPGAEVCQACGFPATASGAQIAEAVTGIKRQPFPSRKELFRVRRQEIAALPFWKKPFAYALRAVQLIGAVIFWVAVFSLSWQGAALGLSLAVVAELLFQVLKGKPYGRQPI